MQFTTIPGVKSTLFALLDSQSEKYACKCISVNKTESFKEPLSPSVACGGTAFSESPKKLALVPKMALQCSN